MRIIVLAAILTVLFLGSAAAADCRVSSTESDRFDLVFSINPDGTALMQMTAKIPYSRDCLGTGQGGIQKNGGCDAKTISDALFRSMDFFISDSDCNWSYDTQTGYLSVETRSLTEKITAEEDGTTALRFKKWVVASEKPQTINTLEVLLPAESEIISYFPQQNSRLQKNSIFWQAIPSDPIGVKYVLHKPFDATIPLIAIAGAGILLAGLFFLKKTKTSRKNREKIAELCKREETLNKKTEEMHILYLKRRIDEKTYHDAMEKLSLELSGAKAEKKELLEKAGGHAQQKK